MKILLGIFLFLSLSSTGQTLVGKWMIQVIDSRNYEWIKKDQIADFQTITDKIVFTENGEYILRSDSYEKSGLAELSFGYWKLVKDKLTLRSKFGDVLVYEFRIINYNKEKMRMELTYSFE